MPAKKTVTHRMIVGKQPIHENGRFHAPYSQIDLPAGRVKALGDLVTPAKTKAKEDKPSE